MDITSHPGGSALRAHRHLGPYMAWVLRGGYDETSIDGRYRCGAGTLVFHAAYHAHADLFGDDGADVANAPLPRNAAIGTCVMRLEHSARLERLFRDDVAIFVAEATARAEPLVPREPPDWVGALVDALQTSDRSLRELARDAGVSPEHATRSIIAWFGLPPRALKRERRLLSALAALGRGENLAALAADAGYADQSHMTRAVRRATGMPPAALARSTTETFRTTHAPRF